MVSFTITDGRANLPESILFKRYSNRRLCNTNTSPYVTLDSVADLTRKGGGRVEQKPVLRILQGGSGGEESPPDP